MQEIRHGVLEWRIEGSGPSVGLVTSERATDTVNANSSNSHFLEQVTVIHRYEHDLKRDVLATFLISCTRYVLRRNVMATFLICCINYVLRRNVMATFLICCINYVLRRNVMATFLDLLH